MFNATELDVDFSLSVKGTKSRFGPPTLIVFVCQCEANEAISYIWIDWADLERDERQGL